MNEAAVLIVEDDANLREALFETLNSDAIPVLTADNGCSALEMISKNRIGLVISDLQMQPMDGAKLLEEIRQRHPALPAVLMTAHGTIENAVEAMRNGAADYLVKPFAASELKLIVGRYFRSESCEAAPTAVDPSTQDLLAIASRVAATDATVTISGESGCGKEVFARFMHQQSPRREHPFIAINCAAIPENMLEAVLFGYEKGAFTGASTAHPGKFEQAQNGTILLDEISEMDLSLQAKLLRVLQEKEIERIGSRKTLHLNVRVLATTNRDLRQYVANGNFREDLYYRLNVFPLHIPSLRERPLDILPLAEQIISRYSAYPTAGVSMADDAKERLLAHRWPGNVRELENVLQRTLILMQGPTITAADLVFEGKTRTLRQDSRQDDLQEGLRNREFQLILDALRAHSGKRDRVAAALGISTRTLRYKLARMRDAGISLPGTYDERAITSTRARGPQ